MHTAAILSLLDGKKRVVRWTDVSPADLMQEKSKVNKFASMGVIQLGKIVHVPAHVYVFKCAYKF